MRTLVTLLALLSAAADVSAAPRVGRLASDLRVVFLDGDGDSPVRQGAFDAATMDIGRVVAGRCGSRGCGRTVVRRRIRLRVDGRPGAKRFVRVRAFVQNELPGHRVRLDGRILTSAPQLIDAGAPLRVPVAHSLEIEVPASEPQGLITQTIVFIAEDQP